MARKSQTAAVASRLEKRGSTTVKLADSSRAEYDRKKDLLRRAGASIGRSVSTSKSGSKVTGILV